MVEVQLLTSDELSADLRTRLRELLFAAFADDFTEADWRHGLGGVHLVASEAGRVVGHGSVVERCIYLGHRVYAGAYLEAVAVDHAARGRGIGRTLVTAANALIEPRYPVAALSTSKHQLYAAQGWRRWQGPTFIVTDGQWRRTPDEDAGVMVLLPDGSPVTDLTARIAVDDRAGDAW